MSHSFISGKNTLLRRPLKGEGRRVKARLSSESRRSIETMLLNAKMHSEADSFKKNKKAPERNKYNDPSFVSVSASEVTSVSNSPSFFKKKKSKSRRIQAELIRQKFRKPKLEFKTKK